MIQEKKIEALEKDGIFALEQIPSESAPVAILAHGINADLSEDRSDAKPGLFDVIVEKLHAAGIGTIRFDFRGHGKSVRVDGFVSIQSEIRDFRAVLNYSMQSGHQIGAFVACSFGACATSVIVADQVHKEVQCVALVNPVIKPFETFMDPGSEWARKSFSRQALEDMNSTGELLLDESFPLGPEFVNDVSSIKPYENMLPYQGRLLVVHGTNDSYVPYEYSKNFAFQKGCTFVSVDGSEHGFGKMNDRNYVAGTVASFIKWAVSNEGC